MRKVTHLSIQNKKNRPQVGSNTYWEYAYLSTGAVQGTWEWEAVGLLAPLRTG